MKSILGFGIGETQEAKAVETPCDVHNRPVPSLVTVRFPGNGPTLTYYNDQYALQAGDRVFVSGKYAGQLGEVETVTTKFKIRLSDYQRVIAKASIAIHGAYELGLDKMVSYDENAVSPEEFRSWILPPAHWEGDDSESPEDEVIVGDGYELDLFDLEHCDEITEAIAERAIDYCRSGRVAYLSVRDGIGTAFVQGTKWYEVNFRLNGSLLSEAYCDCPYPGLCKHLLAVAMTLRALAQVGHMDLSHDFVLFDDAWFWSNVSKTAKRVVL